MSKEEAQAEPDETRPRGRSRALLVAGLALALLASALPSALSAEGGTERVSVDSTGEAPDARSFAPAISADGRHIAFSSSANNLVPGDTNQSADVFVHDTVTATTRRVSIASDGTQAGFWSGGPGSILPAISADGREIAFLSSAPNLVPGDTNVRDDVFVYRPK
jgi:Tol biopolymer transport system component